MMPKEEEIDILKELLNTEQKMRDLPKSKSATKTVKTVPIIDFTELKESIGKMATKEQMANLGTILQQILEKLTLLSKDYEKKQELLDLQIQMSRHFLAVVMKEAE